jgi:signal peptidase II
VFAGLSLLAAVGIVYWMFLAGGVRDWLLSTALGCVTAGVLGNLHDRLGWHELTWHVPYRGHNIGDPVYAVRDWIRYDIVLGDWSYTWPNFNLADSLLLCGAGLLILHAILAPKPTDKVQPGSGLLAKSGDE